MQPHQIQITELALIEAAIAGDKSARKQISELAYPIIDKQTKIFCRRFCKENKSLYSCTLFPDWYSSDETTPLCEWGNASYAWMLEDLTKEQRIAKFEGRGGATLEHYFKKIAASLPFYERWKDWRFGRRDRAPTYIAAMAPHASRVFLLLRSQLAVPDIAQRLGKEEQEIAKLVQKIIAELIKRHRLHLLDPPTNVSITGFNQSDEEDQGSEMDIESWDETPDLQQDRERLREAWKTLSPMERFILEAMIVDEIQANELLEIMKTLNIRINENVPAEEINRQQLYHLRRQAIAKLAGLLSD